MGQLTEKMASDGWYRKARIWSRKW